MKNSAPGTLRSAEVAGTTTRAGAKKHVPFVQFAQVRGAIRQNDTPVYPLEGFGGDFAKFRF